VADNNLSEGLSLLRQPNVGKMFIAYLTSYTGTAMAPIAMVFGVLELTGSAKDSAIVIAAPTIASIFVLLIGGALADRTSRQKIMVFADCLAMLSQFSMAALFLTGLATVPLLTELMLVNGIAVALNIPAATGLIVQLGEKNQLQAINALLGSARSGAMAGGAALGGVLVALFGAGVTLMIDAVSFGVSAILILSLNPKSQTQPAKASVLEDLRLGWKEFTSHTWLWTIVLQFSLVVAAIEAVFGLIGPAVSRDYMSGATDWGFIAGSFGVGTIVGGAVAIKINVKYPMRFITVCVFFFSGIPLALAALLPVYWVVVTAFVAGVAGQIFAVIWYTTLQHKVPSHMLSRVSAYDHLGSIVLAPLGIVAAGFLYEAIGFRLTLYLAAITIILPTVAVLLVREVRVMTDSY